MFWIVVKQKGLREEFSERCEKEELRKSAGIRHALARVIGIYPQTVYQRAGRLSIGKYYTFRQSASCALMGGEMLQTEFG